MWQGNVCIMYKIFFVNFWVMMCPVCQTVLKFGVWEGYGYRDLKLRTTGGADDLKWQCQLFYLDVCHLML